MSITKKPMKISKRVDQRKVRYKLLFKRFKKTLVCIKKIVL